MAELRAWPLVLLLLPIACGSPPSSEQDLAEPSDLQASDDLASADDGGTMPFGCHGWCWQLPTPTGNAILALSSAGSRLWAVTQRSILHWDGSSWSTFDAPADAVLTSIVAVADDDVWAIGIVSAAPSVGVTIHWDGTAWTRIANPSTGALNAIAASGSNDVWAIGASGNGSQAAAIHWDGHAWSTVSVPTFGPLTSVWSSGPNDVWAGVLGTGLIHFDGMSWSGGWSPVSGSVAGFWGNGSGNVWAIAGGTTPLQWNGSNWTSRGTVSTALQLTGSWGSSSSDVWFSGLARWNGSSFTPTERAGISEVVARMTGSSASDIWAAHSSLWHFDGNKWSLVTSNDSTISIRAFSPHFAVGQTGIGEGLLLNRADGFPWGRIPTNAAKAINGVTDDGFLVGDGGLIELAAPSGGSFANHPITLTTFDSGTTANLRGIFRGVIPPTMVGGLSTEVRLVVGDGGTSLHWDDGTKAFVADSSSTTANLRGIWGADYTQVWAVGDGPTLLERSATTSWGAVTPPATSATTLSAIAGSAQDDVWAVGDAGTILHFTGAMWAATPSGTNADITGISAPAAGTAFATTANGDLLKWNGSSWQIFQTGDGHPLAGVSALSATDVTTAGADGRMWFWNGTNWIPTPVETTNQHQRLWARNDSDAWLVGTFVQGTTMNPSTMAGFAYHFDGTAWHLLTDGQWGNLAAVGGSAANTWIAGAGVILRWTGSAFTPSFTAPNDQFAAVYAADDAHAWAVGTGDGLVTWNGSAWAATPIAGAGVQSFVDIAGSAADDVWALGSSSLYHWDGAGWTAKTLPAPAIHVFSEQRGIVWLTSGQTLYRGDGTTWSSHQPASANPAASLGVSSYYVDVGGRSPTDVWAGGWDGFAYHFDGTNWTTVSTHADNLSGGRFTATATGLWLTTAGGTLSYQP